MARKLGAIHYLDSQSQNVVEELAKMGGAKAILGTVPNAKAMNTVLWWSERKWEADDNWRF